MKLVTIKELSEYIKVKEATLYSWVSTGAIPFYKLNGLLRFDMEEIEKWVKESRVERGEPIKIGRPKKNLDIDSIVKNAIHDVKSSKRKK